ncbi:hypothetical protein C3L29_026315 [Pseudomonas sp. MWU12-2534b]|nr:hypothetical protein C3L29_026315 [Pseudomonas sp. MWU12-2534b]
MEDLIIVVLPVCPVQAQSTLGFYGFTRGSTKIGFTGLTSGFSSPGHGSRCRRLRSAGTAARVSCVRKSSQAPFSAWCGGHPGTKKPGAGPGFFCCGLRAD